MLIDRYLLRFRPGCRFPGVQGPYRSTRARDRALASYLKANQGCAAAVLNVSAAGNMKVYVLSPEHTKEILG